MRTKNNRRAQRYFKASWDFLGEGSGCKSVAIRIANHLTRGKPVELSEEEKEVAWYVLENIQAGEYAEVQRK